MRWLHVYVSMLSLLVVLFFAVTGITLNHPDWVFGSGETVTDVDGRFPADWKAGGEIDWLIVVEHLRAAHGVRGRVTDRLADARQGSVTFKAPGFSADCFFDADTGVYQMTVAEQGAIAVLNDLHRGRDAGRAWAWLIDVSGVFLTVLSLTGLGILFYLKKMRPSALVAAGTGAAVLLVLMLLAT